MRNLIYISMLCVCNIAYAQKSNLPLQVDRQEIDRRGAMVERLGELSNGPIDLIADALKPPANDSDKWFIFIVTKDNDAPSELLKKHFNTQHRKDGTDNPMRSWAMPDEPEKSYAHFNVLRIEDSEPQRGIFKDWFAGVRDAIMRGAETKGYPVTIIQPPKNGKYGPNKTVVAMLFGYDGDVDKYCSALRYAQQSYIASVIRSGKLTEYLQQHGADATIQTDTGEDKGARQESNSGANNERVGAAQTAPFIVPNGPLNPLNPLGPNVDIPPQPQALTLDQLQGILPGAPAEYLLNVLRQRPLVSQIAQLQMQWLQDKAKIDEENKRKQDEQAKNPTIPVKDTMTTLLMLLASGNIMGIAGTGLLLYRHFRKATGQKMLLDDNQFGLLLRLLGAEPSPLIPQPATPNAPPVNSPLIDLLKQFREHRQQGG